MSRVQPDPMPVIILCGGRGIRIQDAGVDVPKPMLEISGMPMLWHVMKLFAAHGHTDFVLALGYRADVIRKYFLHYEALRRDFTIELGKPDSINFLQDNPEQGWRITCIDTGLDSQTGTRLRRVVRHLPAGPVMVTYGDGVGDIDVRALLTFHRRHGRLGTVTAVRPPGRFGELSLDAEAQVLAFREKPQVGDRLVNAGFMVIEREAIDRYLPADRDVTLEAGLLARLAADGQLMAYRHRGFWQPMDTQPERDQLNALWEAGRAPWKTWQ